MRSSASAAPVASGLLLATTETLPSAACRADGGRDSVDVGVEQHLDLRDRRRSVDVMDCPPSVPTRRIDMFRMVIQEDHVIPADTESFLGQAKDGRVGLGEPDLVGVDEDVDELL